MGNLSKAQNGFSAVHAVLLLVIIAIVGGTGYYVYSSQQKTDDLLDNSTSSEPTLTKKATLQPNQTDDKEAQSWQSVTSGKGGFSLRIPDGWEVTNYGGDNDIRGDVVTYKMGTKAKIDTVNYQYAGDSQVRFQVIQFKDGDNYKVVDGDETKTAFNVGSLKGTKYYKQYPVSNVDGIGPLPGEEMYTYEFKTVGKSTYVLYGILNKNQYSEESLKINYNQTTSDPNQVQLVERMIKTLSIK